MTKRVSPRGTRRNAVAARHVTLAEPQTGEMIRDPSIRGWGRCRTALDDAYYVVWMAERRQNERSRARTFAWCDGPTGTFYCAVHDASEHGIFLHMGPDLPLGTPLQITLDAIPRGPVVAVGEVVWRRQGSPTMAPGVGLRFQRFLKGREAWERFLSMRRRSPSSVGFTAAPPSTPPAGE